MGFFADHPISIATDKCSYQPLGIKNIIHGNIFNDQIKTNW
jgi:hypothetical protein